MVIYNWRVKMKGAKQEKKVKKVNRACALATCGKELTEKQKRNCCREHALLDNQGKK